MKSATSFTQARCPRMDHGAALDRAATRGFAGTSVDPVRGPDPRRVTALIRVYRADPGRDRSTRPAAPASETGAISEGPGSGDGSPPTCVITNCTRASAEPRLVTWPSPRPIDCGSPDGTWSTRTHVADPGPPSCLSSAGLSLTVSARPLRSRQRDRPSDAGGPRPTCHTGPGRAPSTTAPMNAGGA